MKNFTPHKIYFANEAGEIYAAIEPSGTVARVKTESKDAGSLAVGKTSSVPVRETTFLDVTGLAPIQYYVWSEDRACWMGKVPPGFGVCEPGDGKLVKVDELIPCGILQEHEVYYAEPIIVSRIVLAACPDRLDLFAPDTATAIRDDDGRIVAVRAITR